MLGTSPEEMLKRVQARSTAGLNTTETRRLSRLVLMGAVRSAKRGEYDKQIEEVWVQAERRLKEEVKMARKKK